MNRLENINISNFYQLLAISLSMKFYHLAIFNLYTAEVFYTLVE